MEQHATEANTMTSERAAGGDDQASGLRVALLRLMDEKTHLEEQISQMGNVLSTQRVGMDEPLVDADDYPRADIDVYSVRHARSQLRRLQNDHRALMTRIEAGLAELHGRQRAAGGAAREPDSAPTPPAAFLQVTGVSDGSPAAAAGLQRGDQLAAVGSVHADNFGTLADVAAAVRHSAGRPLPVTVLRDGRRLALQLTPRPWAGAGLLGCSLLPLDRPER
ncbi:26S proteasome non-ATPase regulatory subunit 9-like [Pollicipes pollicipes]|uniref:26S proteasome non-ATPase regulatory subunit 9-like n=1 Tax=Pollicipes pollicipes TaxID=41117 RepID=UPI001885630A|nr:26S proteasome non-ATPase regulatory subunit 9-like [Pollicipes pollicipes]XP_037072305.1 26S proteasome non-ATPase regulatory subunit 9-like [Pollicipes pollicipes]